MAQEQGYVTNVVLVDSGSSAEVDASIGETIIHLADSYAFNEAGGQFVIDDGDDVYEYTSCDPDSDYLILPNPLDVDIPQDTPILVFPRGQQKVAMIQFDDNNEGIRALVPFEMTDRFDDGIRDPEDMESVFVEDTSGRWEITAVDEQIPVVSGAYIDPTTLPEAEAPTAPILSPVLKAVGMPSAIMLVTSPIAGTDWLTYEYSPDGVTWTVLDNMPTKQNIWLVESTPFDGPFVIGVTYYFRVTAGNAAGEAPPSNVEAATLNTSAIEVIAASVVTAELISAAIQTGIINIGSNITISSDGGIEILQSDGGFTRLPSDGSPPQFTGKVIARELIVENGASIYGESDVSGSIELNATIKDPTTAPTTDAYWDVRDGGALLGAAVSGSIGLCRNLANNGWVTIIDYPPDGTNRFRFMEILDTGVVNLTQVPHFGQTMMGNIVVVSGDYYYLQRHGSTEWRIMQVHSLDPLDWDAPWPELVIPAAMGRSTRPALGVTPAGTHLFIVKIDSDVASLRVDTLDLSISVVDSDFYASGVTTAVDVVGIYRGSADFGATRTVVQYSTGVRVYNTTPGSGYALDGQYVSADGWPRPYEWTQRGLWYNGGNFRSIDPYGRITRMEPKAALTASWWAYSWTDTDSGHTTLASPRKQWTPPNRALVTVTSASPPQAGVAGTDVASGIQVYAASSAVATLYKQGGVLTGGILAWPYNPIRETVTAHAGANNWSGVVVPGELISDASDADGKLIDLNGDGSGRAGPYKWTAAGSSGPPIGQMYRASGTHTTSLVTSTITQLGSGWTGDDAIGTDSGRMFSAYSAGAWTLAYSGTYLVNAAVSFASNATGRRVVMIYVNGSHRRRIDVGSGGTAVVGISYPMELAAGDVITIRAFQSSGGNLALDGGNVLHEFSMMRTF